MAYPPTYSSLCPPAPARIREPQIASEERLSTNSNYRTVNTSPARSRIRNHWVLPNLAFFRSRAPFNSPRPSQKSSVVTRLLLLFTIFVFLCLFVNVIVYAVGHDHHQNSEQNPDPSPQTSRGVIATITAVGPAIDSASISPRFFFDSTESLPTVTSGTQSITTIYTPTVTSSDTSKEIFSTIYESESITTTPAPTTSSSRPRADVVSTVTVTTSISASSSEKMMAVTEIPTTITRTTTLVTRLRTPYTGTATSVCTTVLVAGNALPTYASGKCGKVLVINKQALQSQASLSQARPRQAANLTVVFVFCLVAVGVGGRRRG